MQFLEDNEIWEWCATCGIALSKGSQHKPSLPAPYAPALAERQHLVYAKGKRSGREASVAATVVEALDAWDECLLWLTQVGTWPSSEDWPHYYGLRGQHGERRSWETAPGHLFTSGEQSLLVLFLIIFLESGWDGFVLPAIQGQAAPLRAVVSHDEYIEIHRLCPSL